MIFGDENLVHIDGAECIRIACLGQLTSIAEDMGMGLDARNSMMDAVEELCNRLKAGTYKNVKEKIP